MLPYQAHGRLRVANPALYLMEQAHRLGEVLGTHRGPNCSRCVVYQAEPKGGQRRHRGASLEQTHRIMLQGDQRRSCELDAYFGPVCNVYRLPNLALGQGADAGACLWLVTNNLILCTDAKKQLMLTPKFSTGGTS